VKLSAGIQHQAATLDNAIYTLPGQPLVPERAAVVEGAIEQRIGSNWRLNLSAYHRRDADRLRQVNSEVRIENNRVVLPMDPYWANVLSGDTNGVEVVLERRAVSGLNGWVSYAWSDSRLEDSARGESFPADYDQRHTVNAYVGFRWGGKTNFSARYRFGSNFPMTGYIGEDPNGYVLTSQRNGLRLPEYARLDLRADRAFTYRRSRLTLFIEVVNATNRDNYRYESPGINFTTRRVFGPLESLFPLLPVAGVLVEF
jgi:outer membrane cobalamin receptor